MHDRKSTMAELADGFIALPGGLGTLEELFEILTWAQLGIHRKPCALLNVDAYYEGLVCFLDHAVEEGFIQGLYRGMILVDTEASELLDRMTAHTAPEVQQWIELGEQ
jgi:uncharacterized protein (TIGR00730 family)